MNPYAVVWVDVAENQLADIWILASDRNAITAAQDTIDRLLRQNPQQGTHIAEGLWSIFVPPVRAFYSIDDVVRKVEVTDVREYHP